MLISLYISPIKEEVKLNEVPLAVAFNKFKLVAVEPDNAPLILVAATVAVFAIVDCVGK